MKTNYQNVCIILIFLLGSLANAHKPIFTSQKGIDPNTAITIEQPDISQVIYRQLSDNTPQLWLAVDANKDFELFVQMGIPVIERLKYFRPAFAIVGPNLPEIALPFSIPKESGGTAFTTLDNKPRFFHEHFTKTDSWILRSETITLPSKGRYYVVAYSPCKLKGKFWLSVGNKEKFGILDWLRFGDWRKKIREFHEAGQEKMNAFTLDDFSDPNHVSNIGTNWRLVTDRVMGGVSDAKHSFGNDDCFNYIRMAGNVSLENNGGFIQISLPLSDNGKMFDATGYSGVRFWVKGNNSKYYVHLNNEQTRLHWQYWSAGFIASDKWKLIEIPFENFKANALNEKFRTGSLNRIAIVGAKKEFKVDINIGPIEFYGRSKGNELDKKQK